jgi:uncharacterized iron-regulated membrane protein
VTAALAERDPGSLEAAEKALRANRTLAFNGRLDAYVAMAFLALVSAIILLSIREWWLLLCRRKPAQLQESAPVWLPDHALKEGGPSLRTAAGMAAIALGLAKELSGEAALERARLAEAVCVCEHQDGVAKAIMADGDRYVEMTERRFNGVTRCC